MNRLESKYNNETIRKTFVLFYLNLGIALILLGLLFALIFIGTEAIFYLLIFCLLILLSIFAILALYGYYNIAVWTTIVIITVFIWFSIIYDISVNENDLFPAFYLSIIIFLSSILLTRKVTFIISFIQIFGLILLILFHPELTNLNLSSLFSYIVIFLILVYVSLWINNLQLKMISSQNLELQKNEIIIKNNEERYKGLIEYVNSGIVIHGPNTEVIDCNQNAIDILGLSKEQIEGKEVDNPDWNFVDEYGDELKIQDYPVMKAKQSMKSFKNYVIGIKKDESIVWVSVNAYVRFMENKEIKEIIIGFIDITTEYLYKNKLLEMSYQDGLTGLHNRRYYEQEVTHFEKNNKDLISLIMADINGLKLVNDKFGHQKGDELIKATAHLLEKHNLETGTLCRIGGDEFVYLLPNLNKKQAEQIVNKINEEAKQIQIEDITLSISFGVATRDEFMTMNELFSLAEDRMYKSKRRIDR